MKITFFGAAQNITGSKHLIESQGYNLFLDCGLYQGKRDVSNQLNKAFPFSADKINAVILSHAHLDHCGSLPILVKNGFQGKIYCTGATAEIAKYILLDSAAIQSQDSKYFNKHFRREKKSIHPLYTKADVLKTLAHFETVPYFRQNAQWTELNENIRFKFYDAGHILGSAIILLEVKEDGAIKNLVFSGDLGREYLPILRSPEFPKENAETLIMECTYGDKMHRPISDVENELKKIIDTAVKTKGKIIIPAFSLGRIQELIYILHKLVNQKIIPALPIYIDSPLAINITDVFRKYTEDFDEEFWQDFGNKKESPFSFDNLIYLRSAKDSKALNSASGPFVIIAASGMAEGGRILHHLKNNISNPNNIILITGYQAENTLGRKIQEGFNPIRIFDKNYNVNAKIITLDELSAHAGQDDLLKFVGQIKKLDKLFLVHTEMPQAGIFKELLNKNFPGLFVAIPSMGQSFEV